MSSDAVPEFEKLLAQILPDPRDRETFQRTLGRLLGQSPSAAATAGPEAQPKADQRIESKTGIMPKWLRSLAVELERDSTFKVLIVERYDKTYVIRAMEEEPGSQRRMTCSYAAKDMQSLLRIIEEHAPPLLPFPPRIVPSWRDR